MARFNAGWLENPQRHRLGLLFLLFPVSVFAIADSMRFDIPAQPLPSALKAFADQAKIQLLYRHDAVKGAAGNAVVGDFDTREALRMLLEGTGLAVVFSTDDAATIRPTPERGSDQNSSKSLDRRVELEEIVVTGTHLRGVQPSSPVLTITQEEMRLSGHNNLGEAIRAVPQNFGGGQNPGLVGDTTFGGFANQNITGSSGVNLRGLGPDSSLTLLNGARLPYDGTGQATDVTSIPTAAIERIEILLDGASAIYGSDAVGGVANIVLKRDYEGAEFSARYGEATDGGHEQTQYTAVGGDTWDSGGFLITGDFSRNTGVRARQRDYLAHIPQQDIEIYFPSEQTSALFSGHQEMSSFAELTLDAFYTERDDSRFQATSTVFNIADGRSTIWGLAPALRLTLPRAWSLRLHGTSGRNEADRGNNAVNIGTGAAISTSLTGYHNKAESAGVEAEGALLTLPGGPVRVSLGAGWRRNGFVQRNLIAGTVSTRGEDESYYGYGELSLPLIAEEHAVAAISRLSLNAAVRHEDYESFGGTTTPKVGAIWSVVRGFDVKANWGRSFKVPTLRELYADRFITLVPSTFYPPTPADMAVLSVSGGNSTLGPERAEVITAGLVAAPESLPGFSLELNWFQIDYDDRIVTPITSLAALTDPIFADFVTLNPTLAQQQAAIAAAAQFRNITTGPYDPAQVHAIVDNSFVNALGQQMRGVDLVVRYAVQVFGGRLSLSGNTSWLSGERKLTRLAAEQEITGLNYFPPDFKGHFGASWSRGGFTLSSHVNHIGGVKDSNANNVKRDSMTTVDLIIDYQVDTDLVGDVGFNIAVINALNQRPPFLQPPLSFVPSYDSTNYSALGRVVSATVTKRF